MEMAVVEPTTQSQSLPELFPTLATALTRLGFRTPTPIQSASALLSMNNENLLLIAPTGSGKTLAYLLPALAKATATDGTVLVVAPTRELAVQLARDAVSILANLGEQETVQQDMEAAESAVLLAVRGVNPPSSELLDQATVLIGTPGELLQVFEHVKGGKAFLAGDTLGSVVLDEVDVLLPLAPKTLRTNLDQDGVKSDGRENKGNAAENERRRLQEERQKRAHKRKLMALKRSGTELTSDNKQGVTPTERLLRLIASCRIVGSSDNVKHQPPQVIAGSATASRRTLDRLNRAMRVAAAAANSDFALVWANDVVACRPDEDSSVKSTVDAAVDVSSTNLVNEGNATESSASHTIRAVTVPSQVQHRYIVLSKEAALSSEAVLGAVAKATKAMKTQTALLFLCGEFAKSTVKVKAAPKPVPKGSRSSSRRNSQRKYDQKASEVAAKSAGPSVLAESSLLSARKTCDILGQFGIEAKPLHVALGLEQKVKVKDDENVEEPPPFLVTFEGSARGLHFDAVDAVFVVGRPASAASYLHLAGRVGRSSTSEDGSVVIRPGTVVSLCTKGSATELDKWTRQIGGTSLEELVL